MDEPETPDGDVVADDRGQRVVRDVDRRAFAEEHVAPDAHRRAIGAQRRERTRDQSRAGRGATGHGGRRREIGGCREVGGELEKAQAHGGNRRRGEIVRVLVRSAGMQDRREGGSPGAVRQPPPGVYPIA